MAKQDLREALSAALQTGNVPITQVPEGVRSLPQKPRREKKTGRPPKDGERYPSGKLKPIKPSIDPIAPALWERLKTEAVKAVNDSRFGSEVGRLSMHGELSSTEAAAGFRLAQIYGQFERYKGQRRSAASPSYFVASSSLADDEAVEGITPEMLARAMAEELLTPEQLDHLESRIRAAEQRFVKLQKFMRVFPSNVRAALEVLCVEDGLTNPAMVENLRAALGELATFFRIKAAPKEKRITVEKRVMRDRSEVEILDPDQVAFLKALEKLRPDLDQPSRIKAYVMLVALRAREVVRRQKKQDGRPVYLHPKDAEFRKSKPFRRELS